MAIWKEIKKAINSDLNTPLNIRIDDTLRMTYLNDVLTFGAEGIVASSIDKFRTLIADTEYLDFLCKTQQQMFLDTSDKLGMLGESLNTMFNTDVFANITNYDELALDTAGIVTIYENNSATLLSLLNNGLGEKIKSTNTDFTIVRGSGEDSSARPAHDKGLIIWVAVGKQYSGGYYGRVYIDGTVYLNGNANPSTSQFVTEVYTDKSTTYGWGNGGSTTYWGELGYLPIVSE